MLKDITLGQYYPAKSFIHSLDPRIKILTIFALICGTFLAKSYYAYAFYLAFIFLSISLTKVPFSLYAKTLKPMLLLLIFTAALNMCLTDGTVIHGWQWGWLKITYQGVDLAIKMFLRLIALIFISAVLTYTTSPIRLTQGLEALLKPLKCVKFPTHEVAMMMSLALRFIPTIIDETEKIIKAQTARGVNFTKGGLIKRAKAIIPILIPLFLSAFRRADELAVAMESRCYNGGKGRTSLHVMRLKMRDYFSAAVCACALLGVAML